MDDVRKSVQKHLPTDQRRYFKRARWLMLKHRIELTDEDRAALDVMLRFYDKLAQGYALKEAIFHFMTAPDRTKAGRRLDFWLDTCDRLRPPEFKPCRTMLLNWRYSLLNSFDVRLSNGFTEGCNNAIKTIKRASFGYQNFYRFRKKILVSFFLHPNF